MPMVEVDEAQAELHKNAYVLLDRLLKDKDTGLAAKKLVKKVNPKAEFEDLNIIEQVATPINDRLDKLASSLEDDRKARAEEKKAAAEAKADQDLQAEIDSVRKRYSFTDEGIAEVVARLKAKGSTDVEAAASWVMEHKVPKAETVKPKPYMPSKMDLHGITSKDESYAELHRDPQGWLDQEIANILNESQEAA